MRKAVGALMIGLLASCSEQQELRTKTENQDLQTFDVAEAPSTGARADMASPPPLVRTQNAQAPGIDVTSAPGVAFNYRYAFRLHSNRISGTQEAHAQMCEKLGLARCRITGMRYRLENERDISAMLAIKLDPALARNFGKEATGLVTRAEGMLVDQEISGVDAGGSIANANRGQAQIEDDLAEVEAQLRRAGLSNAVRERLTAEAADLRAQIRSLSASRDEDRESLARTPMVFNYGSGAVVPGFDTGSPIREALKGAGDNILRAFAAIITVLAALLPWALLIGLIVWIVRRLRPGWPQPVGGYRKAMEERQGPEPEPAQ